MIGSRPPPTTSDSHRYGSGFQGSPVDAKSRSELRSCDRTGSSPNGIRPRTSVGDRPRIDTRVALAQRPQPVRRRRRRPLCDDDGAAERVGAHDLPDPHQPAEVGNPEQAIVGAEVGLERRLLGQLDQQAAGHVHGALRPARGAGGVAEVAGMLAVEGLRLEVVGLAVDQLRPPDVACGGRERPPAEPLEHDDRLHAADVRHRLVHRRLQLERLTATKRAVRCEHDLRLGVGQPNGDGRSCKAREDRNDDGAHQRAGMKSDDRLDDHRQAQRDSVARLDTERTKARRQATCLAPQLGVGQLRRLAVLGLADRGERVGRPTRPAADAIPGHVELSADEPRRPLDAARNVQHPLVRLGELDPEVVDDRRPEPLRVVLRATDELPVVVDAVTARRTA